MPRLVVLLEQLLSPVPGGTGRYSRELAVALAAAAPSGWTVGGAVARHADVAAAELPGVDGPHVLPLPRRALVAAWDAGVPLWPGGDSVHAPTPLAPPAAPARGLVVTAHDAVPWTHPRTLTRRGARWHRRAIRRAASRADALLVPTAAVADELARHVDPTGLQVVGAGVTPALAVPPDPARAAEAAARLALPPRYVLAVGTVEPRKGLDVLLAALARPSAPDLPLVVAGQRGWGSADPREDARRAGYPPGRVRVLGRVDDADLAVVLHRAAVLAVPSRAEGFGLPLLEGMAAGVPVVHTDVPALVEVAGRAGVVVPREDPAALAAALRDVVADPARARVLAEAGRRRAARYTWEAVARRVWAVHLSVHEHRTGHGADHAPRRP